MDRNDQTPPPPLTRILIVDDHEWVRASLRLLLSGEPDLAIIGEASNGQEALARSWQLHPDLVLMNVRMPVMNGLTATRLIHQAFPATKILILSIAVSPEYRVKAQQAGAAGYLLKEATHLELVTAIHQVLAGKRLFD